MRSAVKIGPIVYKICMIEGLVSEGTKLFGEVKHDVCEIRVEARNDLQQARQTLWHEIVHVILSQAGLAKDAKREELVDPLAYGVMGVLQDNPWLCGGE